MVRYGRADALDLASQRQWFPGEHPPLGLEKADDLAAVGARAGDGHGEEPVSLTKSLRPMRSHGCCHECVQRSGGEDPTNLDF